MLNMHRYAPLCERLHWARFGDKWGETLGIGSVVGLVRGGVALSVRVAALAAIALIPLRSLSFRSAQEKQSTRWYWTLVERHAALEGRRAWHELIPGMAKRHPNFEAYFTWQMSQVLVRAGVGAQVSSQVTSFASLVARATHTSSPVAEASRNALPDVVRVLLASGMRPRNEERGEILSYLFTQGDFQSIQELGNAQDIQRVIDAHPALLENIRSPELVKQLSHWGITLCREEWDIPLHIFECSCISGTMEVILPMIRRELMAVKADTSSACYPLMTRLLNHASNECILRVLGFLNGDFGSPNCLECVCADDRTDILALLLSKLAMQDLLTLEGCMESLLLQACRKNYCGVANMLLVHGMPINPTLQHGECEKSYLWVACSCHSTAVVTRLIEHDVNIQETIKIKNNNGSSLLQILCFNVANRDIILQLLKSAPNVGWDDEPSALWILIMHAQVHSAEELQWQIDIARALIKALKKTHQDWFLHEEHGGCVLFEQVLIHAHSEVLKVFYEESATQDLQRLCDRILQKRYERTGLQGIPAWLEVIRGWDPNLLPHCMWSACMHNQRALVDLIVPCLAGDHHEPSRLPRFHPAFFLWKEAREVVKAVPYAAQLQECAEEAYKETIGTVFDFMRTPRLDLLKAKPDISLCAYILQLESLEGVRVCFEYVGKREIIDTLFSSENPVPLISYCPGGRVDVIQRLSDSIDVEQYSSSRMEKLLDDACSLGAVELIKLLLDQEVRTPTGCFCVCMLRAGKEGANIAALRMAMQCCIERQADINSPLGLCLRGAEAKVVICSPLKYLYSRGCDDQLTTLLVQAGAYCDEELERYGMTEEERALWHQMYRHIGRMCLERRVPTTALPELIEELECFKKMFSSVWMYYASLAADHVERVAARERILMRLVGMSVEQLGGLYRHDHSANAFFRAELMDHKGTLFFTLRAYEEQPELFLRCLCDGALKRCSSSSVNLSLYHLDADWKISRTEELADHLKRGVSPWIRSLVTRLFDKTPARMIQIDDDGCPYVRDLAAALEPNERDLKDAMLMSERTCLRSLGHLVRVIQIMRGGGYQLPSVSIDCLKAVFDERYAEMLFALQKESVHRAYELPEVIANNFPSMWYQGWVEVFVSFYGTPEEKKVLEDWHKVDHNPYYRRGVVVTQQEFFEQHLPSWWERYEAKIRAALFILHGVAIIEPKDPLEVKFQLRLSRD